MRSAEKFAGMSEWIPVTERLPESDKIVLWIYQTGEYTIWARGEHDLVVDEHDPPITHWMPLPAAPKEAT